MWAALPKDYQTESNNMFRNLSVIALLSQNVIFEFANANIPPSQQLKFNLSRMIRPRSQGAHGGGRVVSASDSETSVSSSMPTSAIIYDAYTSIMKIKKNEKLRRK